MLKEVYFRIKDKEESWETNMQFQVSGQNRGARIGPVPVRFEPQLLEALRKAGMAVIRPLLWEIR